MENLEVFDAAGKLLITRQFEAGVQQKKVELNISNLPEGTYAIAVTDSAGERFSGQITVVH